METEDWFTRVDRVANEYFAKPGSRPECFVRLDPPPFVGISPTREPSRTYHVQKDLSGQGKHRINLWSTDFPPTVTEKL